MKKVISLLLVVLLLTATLSVSFSAYSVVDVDPETGEDIAMTCPEAIAAYEAESELEPGSVGVQRLYFQMPNGKTGPVADEDVYCHHPDELDPETGEVIVPEYDELVIPAGDKAPSWFNDNNVYTDGKHYAGIYWWGGPALCSSWAGYRCELVDEEQGIYCAEIPYDPDDDTNSVKVAIFNNGVDGGTDSSLPIYYQAAQTVNANVEGAWEGDYESLPYGSPDEWSFDNCIFIIDPNQVSINEFSGKQTCGYNPYVYYGNGCYGMYYEGCDEYTGDVDQDCCNPDHFVDGVHVGYHGGGDDPTEAPTEAHVHTPAAAVQENVVPATYKAGGSYDSVVYCSECGEELSREHVDTDPIQLDPNKLYFDTNGTGWTMGTKNKVAFHIFGGDLTNVQDWGARKEIGTAVAGQDGLFEFDPVTKLGYTFNEGVQYKIIFARTEGANWFEQTYDLFFTTDCFGHVAYCDGTLYENPVDSSKKALAAYWYGMDASVVGPVKQISSIGNVVGTCLEEGTTDESLFNDFLTVVDDTTGITKYANAMHFTVEAGKKTEQQMIDDIGTDLGLTKQQVYDAFAAAEIDTAWDYTVSTLPGEVVPPHTHTPADPVQENVVPASCTEGGSYDSVVYCSECGEELSREHVDTDPNGHNLTFIPEVPATETATGTKAHYKCETCEALFQDAQGTTPATPAWLVIPMLDHVHVPGTPVQENVVEASCEAGGSYDSVVYCTACGEEISREHVDTDPLGHNTKFVPAKAATEEADGWKSHFKCQRCDKLFADKAATKPVTWEDVRIPKLTPAVTGILGDANDDGVVDIVDVTIIQRYDADIKLPTGVDVDKMKVFGDVNKDGEVDVLDATILQRWMVGLEQTRGIGAEV